MLRYHAVLIQQNFRLFAFAAGTPHGRLCWQEKYLRQSDPEQVW